MATNTRNKLSVYTAKDISASELTDNNTFIPAFKPGTSNYKVPVSSFYGTFQPTSGMTAYYDKTEVDSMIADFGGYEVVGLVNDKPDVASPDTKTIYLTKDDSITSGDAYKEWIWKAADPQDPQSTSAWDLIGDTSLDLTPYVQLTGSYTSGNIAQFGLDPNNPDNKLIEDTGYTVSDLEKINNKVTAWSVPPSNDYYPSEALVKFELDGKAPINHASATTDFGVGTTTMYGHVQVVPGDLSGRNYSDGEAAAASHIHGQYLTNDDLPTEIINISYVDFDQYTAASIADPNTFNDVMAILGKGYRPVIGIYTRQVTSGYDYTDFYPLVEIDTTCGLYFSDYAYNNKFCLHTYYWSAISNNFIMTSGTPYDESIIRNYLNKEMPIRAKFNAEVDYHHYSADIYLNTMEYIPEAEKLRWTGIYKYAGATLANTNYHLIDLYYLLSTSAWLSVDNTIDNSIFS